MTRFDVIVIGGGPAGAISALKCAKLGLSVLLIERGARGRHKPCGGVLPTACADIIFEELGKNVPQSTMCSPEKLGLYYVPPSGRKNGGNMRSHELLNINRDSFDQWLCALAEESGVKIWHDTEFLEMHQSETIQVLVKRKEKIFKMTPRYFIGADGVYSRVRRQLYAKKRSETLPVLQEYWRAEGDFEDYFYFFLRGSVTPTYAYIFPKDGVFVVGIGIPKRQSLPISTSINYFKDWLFEEFNFKPLTLERRETWAIPYGFTLEGIDNVILVGDAAGFCKSFSGEGIRLAIESGIAAGDAIQEALVSDEFLAPIYKDQVEWISRLVHMTHEFVVSLTDEDREEFVKSELNRIPFNIY